MPAYYTCYERRGRRGLLSVPRPFHIISGYAVVCISRIYGYGCHFVILPILPQPFLPLALVASASRGRPRSHCPAHVPQLRVKSGKPKARKQVHTYVRIETQYPLSGPSGPRVAPCSEHPSLPHQVRAISTQREEAGPTAPPAWSEPSGLATVSPGQHRSAPR